MARNDTWICENDRYCADATEFESVEEFEEMVTACFPGECDGFELRPGTTSDGRDCWYDEHDEIALVHIER